MFKKGPIFISRKEVIRDKRVRDNDSRLYEGLVISRQYFAIRLVISFILAFHISVLLVSISVYILAEIKKRKFDLFLVSKLFLLRNK